MKFNKALFIVSLLASSVGFTACDNEEEYVPGAPAGEYNIGFSSQENCAIALDQTELEVELTRANSAGELVVPIIPLVIPECVTIPKEVKFADGEETATITVTFNEGMELFTEYQLSFRIPEKYTSPYSEDGETPIYNVKLIKEDYEVVAYGIYDDPVLYRDKWDQTLEYSALMGLYRMPNCFENGTHWYFAFDGENFCFTTKDGEPVSKFLSGVIHSTYGAVYVEVLDYPLGYDEEADEFYFALDFTVSAGSFGANYESLYITEWIEKPWETQAAE